jgi:hypothetical protein
MRIRVLLAAVVVACLGATATATDFVPDVLVVSNYPEKVLVPGPVLTELPISASVQLLYYHTNGTQYPLWVEVTVTNPSAESKHLEVLKSEAGPSADGIFAGHRAMVDFMSLLQKNQWRSVRIPPRGTYVVTYQALATDKVSVGMISLKGTGLQLSMRVADPAWPLNFAWDGQYPTFETIQIANPIIQQSLTVSPEQTLIEMPVGHQPYLWDTLRAKELKGNYGVFYRYQIGLANPDPVYKKLTLYVSAIGGPTRATVKINDRLVESSLLGCSGESEAQQIYEMVLAPYQKATPLNIELIPTAGSHYPINLVLRNSPFS